MRLQGEACGGDDSDVPAINGRSEAGHEPVVSQHRVEVVEARRRAHIHRAAKYAALQKRKHLTIVHGPDSKMVAQSLLELRRGLLKIFDCAVPVGPVLTMTRQEWPGGTRLIVGRWPIGETQSKAGFQVLTLRQIVQFALAFDEGCGRVRKRTTSWVFGTRMPDEIGMDHEPVTVTREDR